MRRHEYKSRYNPAATELSQALRYDTGIRPDMLAKITRVLDGVEVTDNLLVQKDSVINQKDTELQSTNNLLVEKDQKIGELQKNEFIDLLHKISPVNYPLDVNSWQDLEAKRIAEENDYVQINGLLPAFRKNAGEKQKNYIKNEFMNLLYKINPDAYPQNLSEWKDTDAKAVVDRDDYALMNILIPAFRKNVEEKQSKELQEARRLREEENARQEQLLVEKDNVLSDKDKEIETLNQLILAEKVKIQELLVEKANEQEKLIDKDNLLSDQNAKIEIINIILETKEIKIKRLEQEKEILEAKYKILEMKMQLAVNELTAREKEKDMALIQKDEELQKLVEGNKLLDDYKEEILKFKELCETQEAVIKEKDELLAQKEIEKAELLAQNEIEKAILVDSLQEKLYLKDSEILGLKMMVSEMDLAGDYQLEHLND